MKMAHTLCARGGDIDVTCGPRPDVDRIEAESWPSRSAGVERFSFSQRGDCRVATRTR